MRSPKRFYIGEVLDIYQKGNNSHYGSVDSAIKATDLSFFSLRVFLPLMVVSARIYILLDYNVSRFTTTGPVY